MRTVLLRNLIIILHLKPNLYVVNLLLAQIYSGVSSPRTLSKLCPKCKYGKWKFMTDYTHCWIAPYFSWQNIIVNIFSVDSFCQCVLLLVRWVDILRKIMYYPTMNPFAEPYTNEPERYWLCAIQSGRMFRFFSRTKSAEYVSWI